MRKRFDSARCSAKIRAPRGLSKKQYAALNAATPISFEANESTVIQPALRDCVARAVARYLADLGDHDADNLYRMVLAEVEAPLLDEVMRHCGGNQSHAAQILGITRATLRKKLAELRLV